MFQNVTQGYSTLHAVTQTCMQLQKLACSKNKMHADPWACMQLPKLACNSLSLCGVWWIYICSSFLCLNSWQEFHSACYLNICLEWCMWDMPLICSRLVLNFFILWCLSYLEFICCKEMWTGCILFWKEQDSTGCQRVFFVWLKILQKLLQQLKKIN